MSEVHGSTYMAIGGGDPVLGPISIVVFVGLVGVVIYNLIKMNERK